VEARAYIAAKFAAQRDFNIFPPATFEAALDCAINAEQAYMTENGIYDGEPYGDDEAFERIYAALCKTLTNEKMYLMRFAEDYMDYSEAYMESVGMINWE